MPAYVVLSSVWISAVCSADLRYKSHVSLARRGANRLGIVAVVLCGPALAERRHELGGDQLRGQPIRLATPCPMMGAAAGFHRHDCPGGQLCQPVRQGDEAQVLALQVATARIPLTDQKHHFYPVPSNGGISAPGKLHIHVS